MRTLLFTLLATTALSVQAANASATIQDYRARVNTVAGNASQAARNANASIHNNETAPSPAPTRFYESPSRR